MKYLLLICVDEDLAGTVDVDPDPEPWVEACGPRRLEGHQLRGPGDATLVRDGGTLVSDGPFAETKEQIGGLFLTELPDLDEAIRISSLVPAAEYGSMEIRPIVEM